MQTQLYIYTCIQNTIIYIYIYICTQYCIYIVIVPYRLLCPPSPPQWINSSIQCNRCSFLVKHIRDLDVYMINYLQFKVYMYMSHMKIIYDKLKVLYLYYKSISYYSLILQLSIYVSFHLLIYNLIYLLPSRFSSMFTLFMIQSIVLQFHMIVPLLYQWYI